MKKFMALYNNGMNMMRCEAETEEQARNFFNKATLGAKDIIVYEELPVK